MSAADRHIEGIVREGVHRAYVDADERPVEPEEDDGWYEAWPGPGELSVAWNNMEDIPFNDY